MAFESEFSLSVTRALRDQLMDALDRLDPVALHQQNLLRVARRGGVYELFVDDELVYVGKSTKDLNARLAQHHRKLSGREGGILDRVTFKCVYVAEDLDAMAPEKMLIAEYRSAGSVEWNTNGFGNKDPGRQRDTSLVSERHFDSQYPINLSTNVTVDGQIHDLSQLMDAVKAALPYTFRFERKAHGALAALRNVSVAVDEGEPKTARGWLDSIADRLPSNWSIVALPGYVIAYPDLDPATCDSRIGDWSMREGGVGYLSHNPTLSQDLVDQGETTGDD